MFATGLGLQLVEGKVGGKGTLLLTDPQGTFWNSRWHGGQSWALQ